MQNFFLEISALFFFSWYTDMMFSDTEFMQVLGVLFFSIKDKDLAIMCI